MILLAALLGCAPPPEKPIVVAPRADLATAKGLYRISWAPTPDPIPLAELFVVTATVVDAATGAPVEDASVHIDASMPQHGHGMATKPQHDPGLCAPAAIPAPTDAAAPPADAAAPPAAAAAAAPPAAAAAPPAVADAPPAPASCHHPEGRYRTEGMKFHMPGAWVLTFEVDGPKGADKLELPVEL